jgi:probable rRNA maturation factor
MRTKSTRTKRPRPSVAVQRAARGAPSARRLRAWALAASRAGAEVTLRVVGAAEGRRLNRSFRGRDYAANVLSFAYAPARTLRSHALRGDIVLCHPVIRREARAQGKSLAAHYAHLVVHGMLHLRGMTHARAAGAARMERAEIRILRRLGVADPYTVK